MKRVDPAGTGTHISSMSFGFQMYFMRSTTRRQATRQSNGHFSLEIGSCFLVLDLQVLENKGYLPVSNANNGRRQLFRSQIWSVSAKEAGNNEI
jgi:hypothetical protein